MKFKFKTQKNGYTMAEVLITLGIIGIVAAMVVPTVMNTLPSNNKAMFKKAHLTIEQVVSNLVNDDTNYPASSTMMLADSSVWPRGLNNTTATTNTANKFCYFFLNQLNLTSGDFSSCQAVGGSGLTSSAVSTSDGLNLYFYIPVSDSTTNTAEPNNFTPTAAASTASVQFPISATLYTTKITVDVNGTKGPNCSADSDITATTYMPAGYTVCKSTDIINFPCQKDPDTFIFGIRYDGRIQIGVNGTSDACAINILSNPTVTTK